MPHELISLDRFRSEMRAGDRPATPVYRLQIASPLVVDEAARKVRFCFSDGTLDRVGDTINAAGWIIDNYVKNPVVLWAHDSWAPPIGRSSNILIEDLRLMGDVEFAAPEVYDFADLIFRLLKAGYLNAGSVGFLPLDYSWSSDKDREFGIDFERQELLEYSICPVPANPNALAEARSKGIDTRPLMTWAEKVLDGGGKVILPRAEVEAMRRSAQEPFSRHRSSEDWRCGGARDLPLDESDEWDGPAAEASIFVYAGGDDFDPAKAARGFLIHDAGAPQLRASYKLPFTHAVGGELKAVKGGIRAAASRLPQTDAPQSVLADARKVVDHYEEKFDMKTAQRRDGMSGDDPSAGGFLANCGRKADEECGMKDPEECAMHGPLAGEDKTLARAVKRAMAPILALIERAMGDKDAGDDDGPLPKALDHLKAADDCRDAMPNPDEDGEGHDECVRDMHAHIKAADGYLEKYRDIRMQAPPGEDDPEADLEADKAARAAKLLALAT